MNLQARPRAVLRVLVGVILALTLLNVCVLVAKHALGHGSLLGLVRLFDIDRESNVPAYFSALQMACAASILFAIGRNRRANGDRYGAHWLALSIVFAFLSVDEAAMIHETVIGDVLRANFALTGVWYYAWYIVYGILLIALAVAYWGFFWHLPTRTRVRFAAAAAVFITGAVGLEMLGSYLWSLAEWQPAMHEIRLALAYSVEEPLELLGIAYFVYAALGYAAECGVCTRIEVCADSGARRTSAGVDWRMGGTLGTPPGPAA